MKWRENQLGWCWKHQSVWNENEDGLSGTTTKNTDVRLRKVWVCKGGGGVFLSERSLYPLHLIPRLNWKMSSGVILPWCWSQWLNACLFLGWFFYYFFYLFDKPLQLHPEGNTVCFHLHQHPNSVALWRGDASKIWSDLQLNMSTVIPDCWLFLYDTHYSLYIFIERR